MKLNAFTVSMVTDILYKLRNAQDSVNIGENLVEDRGKCTNVQG